MEKIRICKRGHVQTEENKSSDGRCKICREIAYSDFRKRNKERLLENNKIWVKNNKDRVKANKKRWAENNKEKALAASRAHYANNKDKYKEWRKLNHEKRVYRIHKRRELIKNITVEYFTRSEIYERDGGICKICNLPVDKNLKRPNLMCQSIDHIIPIKKGGLHSKSNVQLTHYICNLRKGIRT